MVLVELIEVGEGSMLGGGAAPYVGGGWIVRRAEEVAILALVEKLLKTSEEFHGRVRRTYRDTPGRVSRNAALNGEAGQILKMADQTQLIILNAIRNKVKCQSCFKWIGKQ